MMNEEWVKVKNRRSRNKKVVPLKHYWCGYDFMARERWFLEMSDGKILTPLNEEYFYYFNKTYLRVDNS